jgi:predicted phosphodiesterase
MKILVIPDIHQTEHYKTPFQKYFNEVDKIVFLGDCFDFHCHPSKVVSTEKAIENFEEICDAAYKFPNKIDVCIGNHDQEYITDDMTNTYQYHAMGMIGRAIKANLSLLKVAVEYDNYVFSHAGISHDFLKDFNLLRKDGKPKKSAINDLNSKLQYNGAGFLVFSPYDMTGYGEHPSQSPSWIRPNSLLKNAAYKNQVVGHTAVGDGKIAYYTYRGNNVIFTDSEDKDLFLVLDTEKEIKYLDIEKMSGKEIVEIEEINIQKEPSGKYSYSIIVDKDILLYKNRLSLSGLDKSEVEEYIESVFEEINENYIIQGDIPKYEIKE